MKSRPSILNQRQIDYLKKLIGNEFNKPLEKREDYTALYRFINEKFSQFEVKKDKNGNVLKERDTIGENTVFRIWGYINDGHKTDDSTYRKLVSIFKFNSLQEFINHYNAHHTDGPLFDPQSIKVEKLKLEEKIKLGWYPYHYLEVKYIGDYNFEVIKVVGEFRKKEGDSFKAKKFIVDFYYSINDNNMGFPLFPNICACMSEADIDSI